MHFQKKTLCAVSLLGLSLGGGAAQAELISVACGAGTQANLCQRSAEEWAERTGNEVKLVSTPNSTTEQLALYQQLLAAQAPDIDVFMIDVIWPGILGNHLIDLKPHSEGAEDNHFQAIIENNTVNGELVGMPFYTDAGILYYRTDLLEKYGEEPPKTWEELTRIAQKIQDAEREAGNDKIWGFVWQGRAYEGLTCDALEWVKSHGGGTIVDDEGKVTIDNPGAVKAVNQAAGWVGTISPNGVLNYGEEEARGVFQSGNAVFMRNWPYAWALSQGEDSPVKGKVGVSVLPKGAGDDGQHAAVLGGWQLAVSKYSRNPEQSADLVMHLTSAEVQKMRAIEGSYLPTVKSLYEDQEVLDANPFFAQMFEVFTNAVPRPSSITGSKYNQVSKEFYNAVHSVLSGSEDAESSLASLESSLKRMSRGGRW